MLRDGFKRITDLCTSSLGRILGIVALLSVLMFCSASQGVRAYNTPEGYNGNDYQKMVAFLELPNGIGNTSGSYQGNVEVVNAIAGNPTGKVDGKRHFVTHQEQMDFWPGWAAFSDIVAPHIPGDPFEKNVFLGNIYINRL